MIRIVKVGNLIFQNIEPKTIDENGNETWLIPTNPTQLKSVIQDTLGWIIAKRILDSVKSSDKIQASTSKSICLLAKVINLLNPDLTKLTDKERDAFSKFVDLANSGYSNSMLLNSSIEYLTEQLKWYNDQMQKVNSLETFEELVSYAEQNLKI